MNYWKHLCKICTDRLPKFTDSYFGETSFRSNDNVFNLTGSTHDENNETYDIFNELTEQRKKHPETFTRAYLNINSIRYKFCSIKQLLTTNTVDMLIIAETKIDNSFPDAQFNKNKIFFGLKLRDLGGSNFR